MKKGLVIIPLLMAGASISPAGAADKLSYNYVEAAYISASLQDDVFDVNGNGFGVAGSFSITDDFHVIASYSDLDFDFDISSKSYEIGLGYNHALADAVDLFADVTYVSAEVSQDWLGSYDDNGYGLSLGVRGMASDKIELYGSVDYIDLSDSGSDTSISAGIGYYLTDKFQLGGSYTNNNDGNSYSIGVRFYFGE